MTTVVMDSKNEIELLTTGKMAPRPEIEADNAAQAAKAKAPDKVPAKAKEPEQKAEESADDAEGEDGLTARQKRDWTEAMLKAVGKKHRQKMEAEEARTKAEEFATSQYNERKLADERAAAARREADELRSQIEAVKPKELAKDDLEPDPAKYTDQALYTKDLLAWNRRQAVREFRAEELERAATARRQEAVKNAEANIARARELVPDFDEKVKGANLAFGDPVADYIWQSEMFPEITYYFANNPKERDRVASLNVASALVAIGMIQSKLTPFASRSTAQTDAKVVETESTETRAVNGSGASPSRPETESALPGADPSKPRESAPVITPLSSASAAQVEKAPSERTTPEEISAWQRRNNVDFGRRKRH
jgi:hypothetical protein